MSEADLWTRTRDKLGPFGLLKRVENRVEVGTPDAHYLLRRKPGGRVTAVWLELKHESAWPRHAGTPVCFEILTLEQVQWHQDYAELGGRVYTLAQVDRTILLLDARTTADVYWGRLTRRALEARALVVDAERYPTGRLIKCLTA